MVTEELIEAEVGMETCMGILFQTFPLRLGNNFAFKNGYYCANMCAENLKEAKKRFLPDGMVKCQCIKVSDGTIRATIIDERIPKDWTA